MQALYPQKKSGRKLCQTKMSHCGDRQELLNQAQFRQEAGFSCLREVGGNAEKAVTSPSSALPPQDEPSTGVGEANPRTEAP